MNQKKSLTSDYFNAIYESNEDPWDFETSAYEAEKYVSTITALPNKHYESVLEVGCSIGVLTMLLARHSTNLLAIDISQKALDIAARRCNKISNITFKKASFPKELPEHQFNLIVVSEVVYYLTETDWQSAIECLYSKLPCGGHVVLVHWLPEVHDYPQTGDQVHDTFQRLMQHKMENIFSNRTENYRIDVWGKL